MNEQTHYSDLMITIEDGNVAIKSYDDCTPDELDVCCQLDEFLVNSFSDMPKHLVDEMISHLEKSKALGVFK